MKYKLYEEIDAADDPLLIRLVKTSGGSMRLIAVDKMGNKRSQGALLDLESDGKIYRHEAVSTAFGFALDDTGRIKVSN